MDLFTAAKKYWRGTVDHWVKAALEQCSPFCNWNRAVGEEKDTLSLTCVGIRTPGARPSCSGAGREHGQSRLDRRPARDHHPLDHGRLPGLGRQRTGPGPGRPLPL